MRNKQVSASHYEEESYNTPARRLSLIRQVQLIGMYARGIILDVGGGNGNLCKILNALGYRVNRMDIDLELAPDILGDITDIPLRDEYYSVSCAFEVLEHLPYSESMKALGELRRVSRDFVIISIPYSCLYLEFNLFLGFPFSDKRLALALRLPNFWLRADAGNPEHYWEIGRKGYGKTKFVKDMAEQGLKVIEERHIAGNRKHYFIVAQKL